MERRDLHGDEARVRIDGPQLLLEPNTAQTIAMALHELATRGEVWGSVCGQRQCRGQIVPCGK